MTAMTFGFSAECILPATSGDQQKKPIHNCAAEEAL